MELLLLTVCGDVSILPPLLNFSRQFQRHKSSKTCRLATRGRALVRNRSPTTMENRRRQFLCSTLIFALAGCQKLSLRSQNPDDDDIKPPTTRFIKDEVTVTGLHPLMIEAVGLVTNLDNTGGDPPTSMYRSMLVNDMRKRGVTHPNTLLQDP